VYGAGDVGLEDVVGALLREKGLTLGVAESCTGGLIGHRITDVPGSSQYFLLGVVAYSNTMKQRLLSVKPGTLAACGAVSEEVVREMAEGVRAAGGTDVGLATSGIAGPGGGTPEKPVGTVCIAVATSRGVRSSTHFLGSRSRGWIKEMTALIALDLLRRELLQW
jgi:nicotinamide-nucleotide amidase